MERNMKNWFKEALKADKKRGIPILSFPIVNKMGITVEELLASSDSQARGIKEVADSTDSWVSVSFMDLSVEAEAFGAEVRFEKNEVPTIVGQLIKTPEDGVALKVPQIGDARTGIYVDGIKKVMGLITDRPVLAGCIGPFSLAGRLMEISDIFRKCKKDPETVHMLLDKATEFLIDYANAYKKAGANGIFIAEPLAGILSPRFIDDFSTKYVRKIVKALKEDNFAVVYHNCGTSVMHLLDSILTSGADAYHFGNAVDMKEVLKVVPQDIITMGNIDPASLFCMGTPDLVYEATTKLMKACSQHKNFVISSGCDIPPESPWENIQSFFKAIKDFNEGI